ncbi:MAG: hypothetical protein K6T80_07955, partial [Firmicutes bacterium]|nr:hypothetical protein [Bacillota bacterium]
MVVRRRGGYLIVSLVFILLSSLFAVIPAWGYDPGELRQMFERLDTVNGGNWQKDADNESAQLAWGESYVMDAYVTMYEATGDTYYLDKFVTHAKGVLARRDSVRGVTDYRGLSLPAWRNNSYTQNGEYAIFAAHTGMIVYPMAKFAAIVAENPSLQAKYGTDGDLFLQAAKDAVAVHQDEWVEMGEVGYYSFPAGMPYKQAGMGLPYNQYLAMARAELMIYRASADSRYLDRAAKMLRHFKSGLTLDQGTGAYVWKYSAFYNSSDEDIGHANIDIDAAYQGFAATTVFTAGDMAGFANTAAKKIIKSDGSIAGNVTGAGTSDTPWFIGLWSAYGQYAPVITDTAYGKLSAMSYGGPTGLLAAAMLNKAGAGGYRGGSMPSDSPSAPPATPPPAGEMVKNGDFSQGQAGWSGSDVVVKTEAGGNMYGSARYGWNFYQYVPVTPGTSYSLSARSRKGSAASEARVAYFFYDAAGRQLANGDVLYKHKGNGWEQIPARTITAPPQAAKVLLKLLVNGGSGVHDFDDISLKPAEESFPPAGEMVKNGDFSQGQAGWS